MARPPRREGVPTAMSTRSAPATAGLSSVEKVRRPPARLLPTSVSRPGSKMGIRFWFSASIFPGILINAGDRVSEIGKTGSGNEPDIT